MERAGRKMGDGQEHSVHPRSSLPRASLCPHPGADTPLWLQRAFIRVVMRLTEKVPNPYHFKQVTLTLCFVILEMGSNSKFSG